MHTVKTCPEEDILLAQHPILSRRLISGCRYFDLLRISLAISELPVWCAKSDFSPFNLNLVKKWTILLRPDLQDGDR